MAEANFDPQKRLLKKETKNEEKRKFDSCFSSNNSVLLCETLNTTLVA